MANEMVKYHNELNTAVMSRWTAEEFNIFFTILSKAKEKGTQEFAIEISEIKLLINHTQSWNKLIAVVDRALDKMMMIYYKEGQGAGSQRLRLLKQANMTEDGQDIVIKVDEEFDYILNRLTANFTIFELADYVQLKSTYSKSMFRLLKQWRTVGKKRFSKDDLYLLLDVPESTQTTANFTNRVLNPIEAELTPLFTNLKIEPIKSKGRGRPITHYKFTWKPETAGNWIEGKYDKPNGKYKKQEVIPDWMNDDYKQESTQPSDPSKEAEIRAKLNLLLGIEV